VEVCTLKCILGKEKVLKELSHISRKNGIIEVKQESIYLMAKVSKGNKMQEVSSMVS
jgi:hypothetical protein